MNTSSPVSKVRFTPAFYLLVATFISAVVMVVGWNIDNPWIYLVSLPVTFTLFACTLDSAQTHARRG